MAEGSDGRLIRHVVRVVRRTRGAMTCRYLTLCRGYIHSLFSNITISLLETCERGDKLDLSDIQDVHFWACSHMIEARFFPDSPPCFDC